MELENLSQPFIDYINELFKPKTYFNLFNDLSD